MSGKKHSTNMQKSYHSRGNFSRIVEEDPTVELQPGEPAPPGMEDMVEPKKCIIQSKLDSFKTKPLIGLEFLIELLVDTGEPNYYCLLCNKQGVTNNIIIHLSSQMHYLKFLQKYFCSVFNALMLVPKTSEYKKGYSVIITRIISRIESKYGRLKPRQCNSQEFHDGKRYELLRIIEEEFHFRETGQDGYVNMVDWAEMKKLQFYNEDNESPSISNEPAVTVANSQKENDNKSLFNKAGRINVDKRQLRKDRESFDDETNKNPEKSPDLVFLGETKITRDVPKKNLNRKSLSSISTESSRSRSRSRSRSHSRSRSKSPPVRGRYRSPVNSRYRHRSRSPSPGSRKRHHISSHYRRSRSRSPSRRYYYRSRSRSGSRSRTSRYKRARSPPLPYPRRRRSFSHSRSPRSRSPQIPIPRYLRYRRSQAKNIVKSDILCKEDKSEKYKWEKFREELRKLAKESEEKQKYYEKNPEKHPQYPEEWKMFWNRRYKELQAEGKDPAKHDFKPEWITFWNKRMKELHDNEFKSGKEKIKLKIGLEEKSKDFRDDKSETGQSEVKKDVTVDDIKNTWKALTGSEIKEGTKSPSLSVVEDVEPIFEDYIDSRQSQTHLLSRLPPPGARQGFIPFDDNSPRVISVLRMVSVLESQLGSLGPKVVALLSKAIAMEKTCRGSSQDILCDEEECVLFETVKEKLKGMLFAGLVDRNFVNMTKVALRSIEDLFLSAPKVWKKGKSQIPPSLTPASSTLAAPVAVPGIGTVDRVAIAQQIAGALIAQGKTDVTEEELEQLINAVVGMAQASSNSAQPITTAEYIQQAQNIVTNTNDNTTPASAGLKLLQTAYNEDENRNSERNPVPVVTGQPPVEEVGDSLGKSMTDLTDKDVKCLLDNFAELMPKEKSKLLAYFKKLESTDPERFSLLQRTTDLNKILSRDVSKLNSGSGQLSPFSIRSGSHNPLSEEHHKALDKNETDDDDDDYSVEDVYKAASEKLRQQELTQERKKIESMLAGIAEAAKKGDDVANLSASFQFSQNNMPSKYIDSSVKEVSSDKSTHPSYPPFQITDTGSRSSQIGSNYENIYGRNVDNKYNSDLNSHPEMFLGHNEHEKRDQYRNINDRPPYLHIGDNRNQFSHDREFQYRNNVHATNRFPSDVKSRIQPPNYDPRIYNRY